MKKKLLLLCAVFALATMLTKLVKQGKDREKAEN